MLVQMLANDKRRTKEERDFITKFKPFAKMQTAQDNEDFIDGLLCASTHSTSLPVLHSLDEQLLRKRITELQELRRLGMTSLAEAETYQKASAMRVSPSLYGATLFSQLYRRLNETTGLNVA